MDIWTHEEEDMKNMDCVWAVTVFVSKPLTIQHAKVERMWQAPATGLSSTLCAPDNTSEFTAAVNWTVDFDVDDHWV